MLIVENSCFKMFIVEQAVMKSITCESGLATLSCPGGSRLHIHNANYGRLVPGKELCPHSSIRNLNCRSANSMSKVTATCENKGSCLVVASNGVFGDPCDGTYKYLEVDYSCE